MKYNEKKFHIFTSKSFTKMQTFHNYHSISWKNCCYMWFHTIFVSHCYINFIIRWVMLWTPLPKLSKLNMQIQTYDRELKTRLMNSQWCGLAWTILRCWWHFYDIGGEHDEKITNIMIRSPISLAGSIILSPTKSCHQYDCSLFRR